MIRIAIAGSALGALVSWLSPSEPAQPPLTGLYVLKADGKAVAAGQDCVAAWRAAQGHIPAGWREIVCVKG
jgi:hypothetical protein